MARRRCARLRCRPRRRRSERGAVAVEGGLVMGFVLLPLLLGMLQLGQFFWDAQRVDAVTPTVPEGVVVGTLTCAALEAQVADGVLDAVRTLAPDLAGSLDPQDVDVVVVTVLPEVGVTVRVHLVVPATSGLASLFPLPGGGALITDFTQHLDDVALSTASCP